MSETRDGFEVVEYGVGEAVVVVHFVACDKNGRLRERVEMGLMRNMDLENFFVRDSRDSDPEPSELGGVA